MSHDIDRVTANGIDFAYLHEGDESGPLALCLHGFPDHAPTYSALLRDLSSAGYYAVAPWMRGYAPTGLAPDGHYHSALLALDAHAIADALAPGRDAVLIGHDWGAVAAYAAVTYKPGRFAKLVTMAVPPPSATGARFLTNPRQLKRSWYMFFFQMGFAEMAVRASDFAFIDMLWGDWSPGFSPDETFMKELKETLGAPGALEAALGYYRAMWGGQAPPPAAAEVGSAAGKPIDVPTLYLHGAADGCLGIELVHPEEWTAAFPAGIETEIVDNAGHFLHLERPDVANARIVGFLRA